MVTAFGKFIPDCSAFPCPQLVGWGRAQPWRDGPTSEQPDPLPARLAEGAGQGQPQGAARPSAVGRAVRVPQPSRGPQVTWSLALPMRALPGGRGKAIL